MLRVFALVIATTAMAACGSASNDEGNAAAGDTAAANADAAAKPTGPAPSFTAGQNLAVTKDRAACRETGPNAGDPWELSKGAFVKYVSAEGAEARVEHAPGMECVVAADALAPA